MTTELRLDAVVLAAGFGRRFGGGKLMARWGKGLLIEGALSVAMASPARTIIVVTGADPRVGEAARAFLDKAGQVDRLRLVHAEDFAQGLSASLRAGLGALRRDCEGVFVFLGDMPRVPTSIFPEMTEALDHGAVAVAPVFRSRRGHPVLFSPAMFTELMALEGDKGANALLDGIGERLTTVVSPDDGVIFDVDVRTA